MTDYTTTTDVKNQLVETLGSSTDTSYDAQIASLITSTSRAIDGYLGVEDDYFYPSSDAETRYYDGNGQTEIRIDDYISITELSVAESGGVSSSDYIVWSSTDYFVYPYNAQAKGKPYKKIVIDIENGEKEYIPAWSKAVKVTGVFGYSATPPADIAQACMVQTLRAFMRAKSAYQDAGANANLGQMFYVKELDPDVKTMLQKYVMELL